MITSFTIYTVHLRLLGRPKEKRYALQVTENAEKREQTHSFFTDNKINYRVHFSVRKGRRNANNWNNLRDTVNENWIVLAQEWT